LNTDAAQRNQQGVLLAAFVLLTLFLGWTALSDGQAWGWGRPQTDHYNLLVHGFLKGHLYLDAEVPRALTECPDPYDPALRPPGAGLHDASLYQGHYYIYHGAAPAVCLLLPWRVLSGADLPLGAAVLVFSLAATAVLLLLAESFRTRFFPACGPVTSLVLLVSLGLTAWAPVLLRRYSLYDLPIAAGQFFGLAAFYALHRVIVSRERRTWWLALSSLCWGLAVASRPTYLLAPLAVFVPLVWFRNDSRSGSWRGPRWSLVLAAVLPVALVGALVALYNHQRFGNPLEFGVRYILSGVYESKVEHFSLRYLPWNLGAYFWAPASWSRYFPFVASLPLDWARPAQHFGMDFPFGLLRHLPLLWFLPVIPLLFAFRSPHAGAGKLRRLLLVLVWVGASVAAFLLCFYAAMLRYVGDFAPWLCLLSVIGGMAWADGCSRKGLRLAGSLPPVLAGAFTAGLVALFSLQAYGRLSQYNPGLYSRLGDLANRPVFLAERAIGASPFGALLLRVRFPSVVRPGAEETLVSDSGGSRLLLRYPEPGRGVFVFAREGQPERTGEVFELGTSQEHRLRLLLGSLLAPEGRPEFAPLSPSQRRHLFRTVRVELDGRPLLSLRQGTGEGIASGLHAGSGGFSGEVLECHREPFVAAPDGAVASQSSRTRTPDAGGWVRFDARFVAGKVGSREPLLVSGDSGRGDFLLVEFLAGGRFRLLYDHWGRSPYLGPELSCEPGRVYHFEVRHPAAVLDEQGRRLVDGGLLRVRVDGNEVWNVEAKAYPAQAEDFFLGENPIGGSSCAARFTGELR